MTTSETAADLRDVFTREERVELHRVSDLRSWWSFAVTWGLIAAAFAMVAYRPNIFTVVLAIFIIGARQLGLAVFMHEAAHRSMFKRAELNDIVGNWLAAYPIWGDVDPYRQYHLQHHAKNWTEEDPDIALATPFPITRESMRRKIWRDLSGQTGWKRFKATLRRDLGRSKGKVRRDDAGWSSLIGVAVTNLALLAILAAFGHPELYLLWVVAWFTTYSLVMRVRAIAEHAMIDDPADPLKNTRTTDASWWERLFIAPNRVNYHLEHHLLMAVPHYNLPKLHEMLKERGILENACLADGYASVLKLASSAVPKSPSRPDGEAANDTSLTFG